MASSNEVEVATFYSPPDEVREEARTSSEGPDRLYSTGDKEVTEQVASSAGDARVASRGVTFSSPESNAATPSRWNSNKMQPKQKRGSKSSVASSTRMAAPRHGEESSLTAGMSVSGKGERQTTESGQSERANSKRLEMAWRRETYR